MRSAAIGVVLVACAAACSSSGLDAPDGGGGAGGSASGGSGGYASGGTTGTDAGGGVAHTDAGSDAGGGVQSPFIYLVTTPMADEPIPSDVTAVDVADGGAVSSATLNGIIAIAYRGGKLLAAQGHGYTRISELDPDSLAVTRTQTLPWDPVAAVFSGDGLYLYATRDDHVSEVRVADGMVTADVQVPMPAGATTAGMYLGIAIDPAGTRLGVTAFHGDTSSVAVLNIISTTTGHRVLSVTGNWLSQPFDSSNCSRQAAAPAFDRAGTRLATFDPNCAAFDVYDVVAGRLDPTASALLVRPDGVSPFVSTVADARGQFWSANYMSTFRTAIGDPSLRASFPSDMFTGQLVTDTAGATIYDFRSSPRENGVYTVDLSTGAETRLPWNLDLVPLQSDVVAVTYAVR